MISETTQSRPKSFSLHKSRRMILAFSMALTLLIGLRHVIPSSKGSLGGSFDAFCPFGGVETLYVYLTSGQTLKTISLLNFSILIGVLAVTVVAGRAFCGWMCPVGGIQEMLTGWMRRLTGGQRKIRGKRSKARLPIQLPPKIDRRLRYFKYVILAAILIASTSAVYPPLHQLCPVLAIFGFSLTTPLLWSVFVTFIVTSLLINRFWCKYLCPLGALLAVFNKISPLHIAVDNNHCVACGRCETDCPMDIVHAWENTSDPECIRCLECVETCAVPNALTIELGHTSD